MISQFSKIKRAYDCYSFIFDFQYFLLLLVNSFKSYDNFSKAVLSFYRL